MKITEIRVASSYLFPFRRGNTRTIQTSKEFGMIPRKNNDVIMAIKAVSA
jgi:hypothetical protein